MENNETNLIASLKSKIGGYKKHNEEYRKQLAKAKETLVALQEENDELKARNERQKVELESLVNARNELQHRNDSLENSLRFYRTNYEYITELPWYKRIFLKF